MSMQMDLDGQPSELQGEVDDLENYASENEICGVCRDIIIDRGLLDGCQHWFCYTCIDNWSAITNRCPLCKFEFQNITSTPVSKTCPQCWQSSLENILSPLGISMEKTWPVPQEVKLHWNIIVYFLKVYDSTGAGMEDNQPLTSEDDDWFVQGESNTLSFPSYYIDADIVICLDGDDCMLRSGLVAAEDDSTLDTSNCL